MKSLWNWRQAWNIARALAVATKRRYRVESYRTGEPSRPWGYTIKVVQ